MTDLESVDETNIDVAKEPSYKAGFDLFGFLAIPVVLIVVYLLFWILTKLRRNGMNKKPCCNHDHV
jgi:heme/copper-type cytochrome/quinol oxidase subunit 2